MSDFYIKLGDTLRVCFGTSNASGAATDADSTPTVTVLEQGSAMGYSPTVANKTTGLYETDLVLSSGNGFEVGKEYSSYVAATVGGTTGRDGLVSFKIAARGPDDLAYPATSGRSLAVAADGSTDANVTLWRGSLPAALNNSSVPANVERWRGSQPNNLTVGLVDTNVATVTVDAINANALSANAVAEIQSGLATAASQTTIIGHVDTVEASLATILALIDTEIAAIKAKTDNLPASPAATSDIPSSAANAAALLATAIEGLETVADALRLLTAVKAGDATGLPEDAEGTIEFLSKDGSKTRVAGTIADGTRTISTRDGT